MTGKIVVYGSDLCPMVPPVRNLLQRAKVDYDYVSISRNRAARAQVMEINNGNASVPTLVFPDGSTLTEPKLAELTARLEALGHTVSPETFGQRVMIVLQDPKILMFGVVFLPIGLASGEHSLTVAGAVLSALAAAGRLPWVLGRGKDIAR